MQTIYMDNASTSYPKAPGVGFAMAQYIEENGMNVFRGGYEAARHSEDAAFSLRERLCDIFNAECPECCILTSGATYGLNMVLRGSLRDGSRVLVSSMEHNAVMRPLNAIKGLNIDTMRCSNDGTLDIADAERHISSKTTLVLCTYADNISGTVMPIPELGTICKKYGVPFVVDASQAVGHLKIDCTASNIDALVFSAHKGLLGPQGIGAALLTRSLAEKLEPIVTGGTGSMSDKEAQPPFLPDKLESGTPNLPGIYGFLAALDYYTEHEEAIINHEKENIARLLSGLKAIPGIRVPGQTEPERRMGVVSIDFKKMDNSEAAVRLEREYGILTRCGLHCAPCAHKTLGTYPNGTVRFSPGYASSEADIDAVISAVCELVKKAQ